MTSLLGAALEELRPYLSHGESNPGEAVRRVDVTRAGSLQLAVEDGALGRWFSFDDRGLIEQHPRRDARLPLAAHLRPEDRILTYRPGRRVVVTRTHDGKPSVLKGYRRRRSAQAALRHRAAQKAANRAGFRVPLLLSHDRRRESLVFQKLEGRPISLDVSSGELFFRIGAHLSAFRSLEVPDSLETHGLEQELGVLERWRVRAQHALGRLPEGWDTQRRRCGRIAARLPAGREGLCHRDLHDGQFLETQHGTALLDHDLLCRADTALDPANLLAHLALRGLQGVRGADDSSARTCGEALLEGYDPRGDDGFWVRLRLYQALTFLRLALLYALRPRWSSLAPNLVQLSDRCLEDVELDGVIP